MYKLTLSLLMFTIFSVSFAQMPGGGSGGMRSGQNMNLGHFYGKILDANTNKPVDAASVQLLQNKLDSVTKKRKDVVVSGMLTTKKGEFSLENLGVLATYKLRVTAIGYKAFEQKVFFSMNAAAGGKSQDMSSMMNAVDKDLGNIKLDLDAQQLQEVTVTSSKPLLTMGIDRKVFNVEKNLTSVGGTAVDVMKSVPGLNVDIDGNVSLRNASPQIFVDGRPTTMTLDQIPADAIATVEIITNPSAKFDASGGGAGILNVVLKKNRKPGYNGSLRASLDSRARGNIGGDLNIKTGKFNFFSNAMLGLRKTISTVHTDRTDYLDNGSVKLSQDNGPVGNGIFEFGRLGMDYFIDNRNTITAAANISNGHFKNADIIHMKSDTSYDNDPGNIYSELGTRTTNSTAHFKNLGTTLSFKHNFAKANKDITADISYNRSQNDNINDLSAQYFDPALVPKTPLLYQRSQGGGTTKYFTSQVDYENPITDKIKLEAGGRVAIRNFYSYNNNFFQDPVTGDYISIDVLNSTYKFTDRVLAAYTTFSQKINKFNYQLGLRIENSKYDADLISKNIPFSNSYPFEVFPSVFATYSLTDKQDLQLNYSRKINRPNFFQLIPFIDYSDSLNLTKGNPDLRPEFTTLMEISYQNQLATGHNLLTSVYFKNTTDLITRYQYKTPNPNTGAKPDSVIMSTYANASTSYTYGLELTSKDKITSWWDLTTNLNFFNATVNAGNLPGGINSNQFSWFGKLNNSFKLPKNYSIQLSGDYQAKTLVMPGGSSNNTGRGMMFGGGPTTPSAQGYIRPYYGADIAIRKDFMKNNAASLTLQMSDIFRTRVNSVYTESIYFVQNVYRRRDPQVMRLSFNWRFGKMDVSLFKRKNLRSEMESIQNGVQGNN